MKIVLDLILRGYWCSNYLFSKTRGSVREVQLDSDMIPEIKKLKRGDKVKITIEKK